MTTTESTAPASPSLRSRFLASALSVLIVVFLFVFAFMLGSLVAATGLHDPDSCWLLASGRYIWENGHLPTSDPFSYTFASLGRPFVMYQWLTEVLFFGLFKFLGLGGLLTVAALSATMTFIALPLIASRRVPNSRATIVLLIVLMTLASSFHILIRPEIISYTILSIFAALTFLWRKGMFDDANTDASEKESGSEDKVSLSEMVLENGIGWKAPLTFAILMLFWANFHTAFTLGLIVMILLVFGYGFEVKNKSDDLGRNLFAMTIGLFLCLGASLINPHGIGLWNYIPDLYFSSMNKYISELRALGPKDVLDLTYTPYLCLGALTVYLFLRAFRHSDVLKLQTTGRIYSILIMTFCIISGVSARRMIPFASILFTYESLFLLYVLSIHAKSSPHAFYSRLTAKLEQLLKPTLAASFSLFGLAALFGAYIVCGRIVPPALPQGNSAFHVPLEAIQYLKAHPPHGPIFNDAQYGDVMIWHIGTAIPVFVDTRYDMYGDKFIRDYQRIRFAEPECMELLKQYSINTVFLPSDSEALKMISGNHEWTEAFRDKSSVILMKDAEGHQQ